MAKHKNHKKVNNTSNAIILRDIQLSPRANEVIRTITPKEFVRQREGKFNKKTGKNEIFDYVEVGYIISQLNKAFTPVGWQFDILEEHVTTTEVYVRGKLTVKDYKTGYEISKTQYGTKEIYAATKTPLGDLLKSASSDCLKKCASLFGIALDIYWKQLENIDKPLLTNGKKAEGEKVVDKKTIFELAKKAIEKEQDIILLNELKEKIPVSKLYTNEQKTELIGIINAKIQKSIQN